MPSYQTVRFSSYRSNFQELASGLFKQVSKRIPAHHSIAHDGSYSITGASTPETICKLIIFESDCGKKQGKGFPGLEDGVHVLIRTDEPSTELIWSDEMVRLTFPQFLREASASGTIGVVPARNKRFAYFRVDPPLEPRIQEAYLEEVALLIATCHRLA